MRDSVEKQGSLLIQRVTRKFAANVGLPFHTPHEYFLDEGKAPFSWGTFIPQDYPETRKHSVLIILFFFFIAFDAYISPTLYTLVHATGPAQPAARGRGLCGIPRLRQVQLCQALSGLQRLRLRQPGNIMPSLPVALFSISSLLPPL